MQAEITKLNRPDERRQPGASTVSLKPSILIVDDESGPREALKVILRPFFNIHSVDSGAAALHILKEHQIDLVTLDLKLPDRSGTDLLQEIKRDQEHVEVIIITGYGSLKSAMDGIRYGASGYLLKPFNVTDLIEVINHCLEKKRRLDGLREILRTFGSLCGEELDRSTAWKNLSRLLEAKDPGLVGHSDRVSFYSSLMAERLGMTAEDRETVTVGAWLHDIGKVGIDARILSKSAPLGAQDCELIKCHPEIGARMVQALPFRPAVGQIIRHHHEQYDGSGYPDGLKGDDIPYLARIVSLANTFVDLTAGPQSQESMTLEDAKTYIRRQAGALFDPTLSELFLQIVR